MTLKLFVAALLLAGSLARGELRFCNQSPLTIFTAVGEFAGGAWQARGWWKLAAGECAIPVGGDLPNRYYYVYAETEGRAREWNGNHPFCTSPQPFTVPETGCGPLDRRNFDQIDTTDADSFTLNFNCDNCTDARVLQAVRSVLPSVERFADERAARSYRSDWIDVGPVDIRVSVTRGPLRLRADNTQISASVRAYYSVEVSNVILGIRNHLASCGVGEDSRIVDAMLITAVGIDEGGRPTARTRVGDMSFANRCRLTVANYDATDEIENALRPRLEQLAAEIDSRIRSIDLGPLGRVFQ